MLILCSTNISDIAPMELHQPQAQRWKFACPAISVFQNPTEPCFPINCAGKEIGGCLGKWIGPGERNDGWSTALSSYCTPRYLFSQSFRDIKDTHWRDGAKFCCSLPRFRGAVVLQNTMFILMSRCRAEYLNKTRGLLLGHWLDLPYLKPSKIPSSLTGKLSTLACRFHFSPFSWRSNRWGGFSALRIKRFSLDLLEYFCGGKNFHTWSATFLPYRIWKCHVTPFLVTSCTQELHFRGNFVLQWEGEARKSNLVGENHSTSGKIPGDLSLLSTS